ncbi:helix-turn-helix domain-containing protein [Mycolicibacterium sp. P1-5]|uniref:helix-turn-helix domain-containing protein n=1 Tax=Mycolicibacterium sp. P1-5 TaxID=2024617 RepID=UPI00346454E1
MGNDETAGSPHAGRPGAPRINQRANSQPSVRAETGLSPLQWLLQMRIETARELLESTDLPVSAIAHRTGMGTVDSLRDHLVRRTGLTPSAYRSNFTHRTG